MNRASEVSRCRPGLLPPILVVTVVLFAGCGGEERIEPPAIEASLQTELPVTNAVYSLGEEPLTMAGFADGWIYSRRVNRFEPVTYIQGWIHPGNLDRARASAMNPAWRTASLERIQAGCRSYLEDHRRWYGRLR